MKVGVAVGVRQRWGLGRGGGLEPWPSRGAARWPPRRLRAPRATVRGARATRSGCCGAPPPREPTSRKSGHFRRVGQRPAARARPCSAIRRGAPRGGNGKRRPRSHPPWPWTRSTDAPGAWGAKPTPPPPLPLPAPAYPRGAAIERSDD